LKNFFKTLQTFSLHLSADIVDPADVLRRVYTDVSKKLYAQSVARNMFQCNALTLKELQFIQSKHSEPVKAAERLLNIVMKQSGNVYSCFLDALKKTDHQHVFELIITGSYRGRPIAVHAILFVFQWLISIYFLNEYQRRIIL